MEFCGSPVKASNIYLFSRLRLPLSLEAFLTTHLCYKPLLCIGTSIVVYLLNSKGMPRLSCLCNYRKPADLDIKLSFIAMRDLNIQGHVIAVRMSLCALMLGRRSVVQRLHKSSLLWWEDYIITSCRKTPKENGSNRDILLGLRWSWSSTPNVLPIDFKLLVLHKHVGESHTASE